MPKDILEILDTATKIGLGAIIGGVIFLVVVYLAIKPDKKSEGES